MKWLTNNLAVLNVILTVLSTIIYLITINWISYLSVFPFVHGRMGVVIDYRWLGQITISTIEAGNFVPRFSFPDYTSYFLTALVLLNGIALTMFFFKTPADEDPKTTHAWKLATRNLILSVICLVAFVYTMSLIDATLKDTSWSVMGGIVDYYLYDLPLGITIYRIGPFGVAESGGNRSAYDFPLLLLLLLLLSTIITIRRQIRYQPHAKPPTETQT